MGHKANPFGLRIGIIRTWQSLWHSSKKREYADFLHEDIKIRSYIKTTLSSAAISRVEIERSSNQVRVKIHTARPGVIIGRRGADIDRLRDELQEITNKEVHIDIKEIKKPAIEAQLVAENVALQLEKRVLHRRAMKRAIEQALNAGAKGIKIVCSGRLGGAEMSRRESYKDGKVPLQTLRADIDYGFAEALTTYGLIGIKVWIYKGDILTKSEPVSQLTS